MNKIRYEKRFASTPTKVWREDKEVLIWLKSYVVEITTFNNTDTEKKLYIEK